MVPWVHKVYSRLWCHSSWFLNRWRQLNGSDDSANAAKHTPTCVCCHTHTDILSIHKWDEDTELSKILLTCYSASFQPPPLSVSCSPPHTHTHTLLFSALSMAHGSQNNDKCNEWRVQLNLRFGVCVCLCERIWCQQGWFTLTYPPTTGIIPPASWWTHITHTHAHTNTQS